MEDIKKNYTKIVQELGFSQFSALIEALPIVGNNYGGYTISQYYLLMTERSLYNQFIEQLFETFEDNWLINNSVVYIILPHLFY